MKFFTKEVKIGIVSLVALFLIIYGINYLKGVNLFKPSSVVYVAFKDINGLAKSSPVFADGYRVGLVHDIYYDYDKASNVIVEVELNTDLRIPKGSSAELIPELMGGVKMNLLLANNPRERYNNGDTIPGNLQIGMMDKMARMLPSFEVMIPKVDSILTSINLLLSNPALHETLTALSTTSNNLSKTTEELHKIMKNEIPELTNKMNIIGDNFVTVSESLAQIEFKDTFSKVDSIVSNLNAITARLNNKDNTLGLLLNDSALYNSLTETGDNAAKLLDDLQKNPKRYVHFSVFGKKQKK